MRDEELFDLPYYIIDILILHELVREQTTQEIQILMRDTLHLEYPLTKIRLGCVALERLQLLEESKQHKHTFIITSRGKEVIWRMRALLRTREKTIRQYLEKQHVFIERLR